jgi:hypothetical protein
VLETVSLVSLIFLDTGFSQAVKLAITAMDNNNFFMM